MTRSTFLRLLVSTTGSLAVMKKSLLAESQPRKLVLIAGAPSHPSGMHEFRAGTLLLARRLGQVPNLTVECYDNGWVKDEATFEDAAAVVIYSDGSRKHPLVVGKRLSLMEKLVSRGVGLGCMHYGVEVLRDDAGEEFKQWLGGYYEHEWSCNQIWTPSYEDFPDHPVSHGVRPFAIEDEWYFNIRFQNDIDAWKPQDLGNAKYTPILVASPDMETRNGPYVYPKGPYTHIQAAKGRKETMLWALEREDGGRGFGFTGGHFHSNWQNDEYRKVVMNAICWLAKIKIPALGVGSATVTDDELAKNLDPKPKS